MMLTTKTEFRKNGFEDQAEQVEPVHPQEDPGAQRDEQDRRRRERQGAHRRAGVELAETGEDQGEERRGERRPGARSRLLRCLHRG